MLEFMKVGIVVSLILIIGLLLFLVYIVIEDYVSDKKAERLNANKNKWFEPGGHLYER